MASHSSEQFQGHLKQLSHAVDFVDENRKQDERNALQELVGPRPHRVNKIQNGRRVNKAKMHRITISSGPCGKLGSTKWGVQKLEVDNIMFD